MNKKNNRKGFTIVELVIVIAVIAILAVVLVPTFGNVIAKAKNASLISEIKNEHTNYVTKYADQDEYSDTIYINIEGKYYLIDNGELVMETNEDGLNVPDEQTAPATGSYWDAASGDLVEVGAGAGEENDDDTGV